MTLKNPPLDTIVNNAFTFCENGSQVSDIQERKFVYRKEKYALRTEIQKHVKRVRGCGCSIQRFGNNVSPSVDVCLNETTKVVRYNNLQSCNSVWSCPVCSEKISIHREHEVRTICNNAQKEGFQLHFLTLTIPHKFNQNLKVLKDSLAEVLRQITKKRFYTNLKKQHAIEGYIRALEVTFSFKNGWHPHLHVLYIHKSENFQEFSDEFYSLWAKEVEKIGLGKCSKKAYKCKEVFNEQGISEYITKWDLSKELVQGQVRKDGDSYSPFALMKEYQETNNEVFLNRFLEFSMSFHGAKQLTYSREVKKKFLKDKMKSDKEICEEENNEEKGKIVMAFNLNLWKKIIKLSLQADILNVYQRTYLKTNDKFKSLVDVVDFIFSNVDEVDVLEIDDYYLII